MFSLIPLLRLFLALGSLLLGASLAAPIAFPSPLLHPLPHSAAYVAPTTAHSTLQRYTQVPLSSVQLLGSASTPFDEWSIDPSPDEEGSLLTVPVQTLGDVASSWWPLVELWPSAVASSSLTALNATAGTDAAGNASAPYLLTVKPPVSSRQREAIQSSLHSTGYSVSAYLPHHTLLLLPHALVANASQLQEWQLSSSYAVDLAPLLPQHKVDPALRPSFSPLGTARANPPPPYPHHPMSVLSRCSGRPLLSGSAESSVDRWGRRGRGLSRR